jgi:pimeloyl-ACP methyl ester carboxylesterase
MTNDELIQEGIEAIQAGKLTVAAAVFATVVKADPSSEQGWYWLGQCCQSREQSEYCYRRVLALNPRNLDARHELDLLTKPTQSPLASNPRKPFENSADALRAVPPPPPVTSPFVYGAEDAFADEPAPGFLAEEALLNQETDPKEETRTTSSPDISPKSGEPEKQPSVPQPKKKSSNAFVWALPLLLLCSLSAVFLYYTGYLNNLSPAKLFSFLAPQPTFYLSPTPVNTALSSKWTVTPILPTWTASPTLIPTPKPTIVYAPAFENHPCDFTIPTGASVKCGYVIVPEDRTDPKSEKVKLAVAVFHSTSNNSQPDPVIFLQGGPGGAAVDMIASAYTEIVVPFLAERDFIVYDQRGTGLSIPALACRELKTTYLDDLRGQVPISSRNMIYDNDFISCHGNMHLQGINLNAYDTENSATDVKDLLRALGYQKVNLYGASYGTRLAQVIMRDYPEIVRSSVVDSVVPIESKLFNEDPAAFEGSLQALFDSCAAEASCHAAYPNLETDFWDLVKKLDAHPVSVTSPRLDGGTLTEDVDGSTLLSVITLGLLKSSTIAPAAQSIYQIKNGDYSTLIAAQSGLPAEFEGISPAVYVQVMCHEHLLATNADQLKADIAAHHEIGDFSRLPFFGTVDDMYKACKAWGAVPPAKGENDPVVSDIPTLVIAGRYDPVTPPAWGKLLASHLKNSYFFEFPANGHCPTFSDNTWCALNMVVDFIHDPTHSPDHSCLDKMAGVKFTTPYTGDPPVKLESTVMPHTKVTISAPTGWPNFNLFGIGDYWRDNSVLDITQMVIVETPYTQSEWLDSLSSKLYGYQGFDAAPVASGIREANGITWDLFTLTSYGRPVDLAMADVAGGSESLIVLLFCHTDEHQALYNTLFLPVLDSATPAK